MPAYAKVALVTPTFHPSDVAFAISWSNSAPGLGSWRVLLDKPIGAESISVIPPGSDEPVFFVSRSGSGVLLERQPPHGERDEVGRFLGLREALLALCPLADTTLEEIQVGLERDFPRHGRR